MPYSFPTIEQLIANGQADVTGSDLPDADGFLPRGILPLLVVIQAGFALGHYDAIAYAMLQATPFTATDEWLDTWAAFKSVFRKDATAAGYTGTSMVQFSNAVVGTPLLAGTPIQRSDGFGYITAAEAEVQSDGTVSAPIVATTTGSAGNAAAGIVLTLGIAVEGISSAGVASTPIVGGAEQELDDDLRTRMLAAFASPPAGGSQSDYEGWAKAVPGVTRAWCVPNGNGAGSVVVLPMFDNAEAAYGGFPQGTNGVATAETRDAPATGDQLTVANALYPLRPVTALVYVWAPVAEVVAYSITELSPNTTAIQQGIETALQAMHLRKAVPGGTLWPSDWNEAIAAVPGIEHFNVAAPAASVTAGAFQLLTAGTPTFSS